MLTKNVTINIPTGLAARPAALLVQIASRYESSVYLSTGEKKVNAKSIMGMMSLALPTGSEVTITTNGSDETAALEGMVDFLSGK